jgi:hypothetical protein
VKVPEEVSAHRVEAHGFGHAEAMPPVLAGDARGVDLAAADDEGLAIEKEGVGADGEGVRRRRFSGARRSCKGKACGSGAAERGRTTNWLFASHHVELTAKGRRRERRMGLL